MLEINVYSEEHFPETYSYIFRIVDSLTGDDITQVNLSFDHKLAEDALKNLHPSILQQAQEQVDKMNIEENTYKPFPKEI